MTEDKPLAPGWKTDQFVAEKVMRWNWDHRHGIWIEKPGVYRSSESFEPSTDLNHAMEVLEALQPCSFSLDASMKEGKLAGKMLWTFWEPMKSGIKITARFHTEFEGNLAFSICMAALQIKIWEQENHNA